MRVWVGEWNGRLSSLYLSSVWGSQSELRDHDFPNSKAYCSSFLLFEVSGFRVLGLSNLDPINPEIEGLRNVSRSRPTPGSHELSAEEEQNPRNKLLAHDVDKRCRKKAHSAGFRVWG